MGKPNPVAKNLHTPQYRKRVVASKVKYSRKLKHPTVSAFETEGEAIYTRWLPKDDHEGIEAHKNDGWKEKPQPDCHHSAHAVLMVKGEFSAALT